MAKNWQVDCLSIQTYGGEEVKEYKPNTLIFTTFIKNYLP